MHHDMWPLAALHGMDRGQGDSANVGRGAQLFREPPGEPARVAFEVSQFNQGVEIVTVSSAGAVAPLVERRGTRVQSAFADVSSQDTQNVGSRTALGRLADSHNVAGQFPHFVSFSGTALGLEPVSQAHQTVDRALLGHKVEERRAHATLGAPCHLPQHRTR